MDFLEKIEAYIAVRYPGKDAYPIKSSQKNHLCCCQDFIYWRLSQRGIYSSSSRGFVVGVVTRSIGEFTA